jgi:conjugative relaxase-like TrwC/TraI family protein
MLRIRTVTTASDAKNYYAEADYYAEGQETVGKWGGKLAEKLDLSGAVTKDAFDRLCDNLNPATGCQEHCETWS